MPGDPPLPPAAQFGGRGQPPQPGAGGQAPPPGGRGGQNQGPVVGTPGFYKLVDTNGDDVMDTIERIQRYTSNGMGDHGPHAIRRAPDGSIMLLIGNNTYVGAPFAPDRRPTKAWTKKLAELEQRRGKAVPAAVQRPAVWQQHAHWRARHGLAVAGEQQVQPVLQRHAQSYDFAFNLAGEAFTFDSDMEWDVNAPWYGRSTRCMIPGGDGGYRNGTGKFQDEHFRRPAGASPSPTRITGRCRVLSELRVSGELLRQPVRSGLVAWPLLYTALTLKGATYTGREDLAEFVHGEPMPITDLEVGPDGNMYLTTGGGAGQGGLYKVSWTGAKPAAPDMTGILAVVRPAAAAFQLGMGRHREGQSVDGRGVWSRARQARAQRRRGHSRPRSGDSRNAAARRASERRIARGAAQGSRARSQGRGMCVAGLQQGDAAKAVAAAALKDAAPLVQRRAAEALLRQGLTAARPSFAPVADIYGLLKSPDRYVRYAGRLALEHTPRNEWSKLVMAETNLVALTEGLLALANTADEAQARSSFARCSRSWSRSCSAPR